MDFFTATLSDILAGFEKTIDALDKLVERNRSTITKHAGVIAGLSEKNSALAKDSTKASSVARKLRELIAE